MSAAAVAGFAAPAIASSTCQVVVGWRETLPLPCVPTAFVAKTLPFRAVLRRLAWDVTAAQDTFVRPQSFCAAFAPTVSAVSCRRRV